MNHRKCPIIEFKEHHLQLEFLSLDLDSRLQVVLYALAGFVWFNFGKSITITEILRTQAMQDEYYKDNESYKEKPWLSVHQFGRGADVSIKWFTVQEVKDIEKFLKTNFVYSTAFKSICIVHDIGRGNHIHIQVDPDNIIEIIKNN